MLILVGGGARSGKSAFALRYAGRLAEAGAGRRPVFVATAQALDVEMQLRIERHRDERGPAFDTVEEPIDLAGALRRAPAEAVVLVDCLTLWLSNLLLADRREADILAALDGLTIGAASRSAPTLVVTNEVGMGLVPETPLGRTFRDLTGRAHQRLGARAAEIYAAIMGVVLRLHPAPIEVYRGEDIPAPAGANVS